MVLVEIQLVLVQNPALLSRASQSLRPVRRADGLVAPPLEGYPRENLVDTKTVGAAPLPRTGFAVSSLYVRPAMLMSLR